MTTEILDEKELEEEVRKLIASEVTTNKFSKLKLDIWFDLCSYLRHKCIHNSHNGGLRGKYIRKKMFLKRYGYPYNDLTIKAINRVLFVLLKFGYLVKPNPSPHRVFTYNLTPKGCHFFVNASSLKFWAFTLFILKGALTPRPIKRLLEGEDHG